MNVKTTRRPRLGLVAGVLAVAVATSSGAYAAGAMITSSKQIKTGVVTSGDLKNGTVKVKDLSKKTVEKLNPAPTPLEAWKPAALTAPWTPFPNYTAPGFRADHLNDVVYLRGATTFNSDSGVDKEIFELPEGYRPANTVTVQVASFNPFGDQSEFGAIEIQPDGDVRIYGESDDRFVSLEGVSFSIG